MTSAPIGARRVRTAPMPLSLRGVIPGLGAVAWLGLVIGPAAALAVETGSRLLSGHGEWLALAVPTGERVPLFWRSVALAGGVAIGAMVIGVLAATAIASPRRPALRRWRWAVLAFAPIPPYIHALAWDTTAARAARLLDTVPILAPMSDGIAGLIEGGSGAAVVMLMAWLPLAVGLALLAIESVPADVVEAARTVRGEMAVFGRIVVPLAAPMLIAACGLLFVLGLLDYSVPTLFQYPVYALSIFAEFDAYHQPARAVLHAAPLMAIAIAAVLATQAGLRRAATSPAWRLGAAARRAARPVWPPAFRALQAIALTALALHVTVLLGGLVAGVGSLRLVVSAVGSAWDEVVFSVLVSVAAALLCLPLAAAASAALEGGRSAGRAAWWLLVIVPLAVPAPLVAVGLITLWNRSGPLGDVYGSAMMPVLAAVARFAPLAALVVLAHRRRLDTLLFDAARLVDRPLGGLWRVRLPLLAPGLIAAAAITFALTIGELGATLLIAPPGRGTLTMRIYNYLHYGSTDAVAGLCLAMAAGTLLAGGLAIGALAGWRRGVA